MISIFLNYECSFLRCLSRLSLRLQAKSQKWHWNGLSPVCVSMWILTRAGVFIIMEQNGHAHELFPSLIGSFWKKNDFNENESFFCQNLHWGLFYKCFNLTWLNKWELRLEVKSHKLHANGRSPVWITICLLKSLGNLEIFEQNGHASCL